MIGIGEVTHGTHEDLAFKAALVRQLIETGAIDMVAVEANRIVGVNFDRYVRYGEGDPAALVRSPSSFKPLKNDEFAGLILWLRAWNLAHPDRVAGITAIDNQDGAIDAAFALDFVAKRDPALAIRLRSGVAMMLPSQDSPRVRPSDWIATRGHAEVQDVLRGMAALRDMFAAHRGDWMDDVGYAEAAYSATVAWQNIHEFELDVKGSDYSATSAEYKSRRDRYMAQNLIARLGVAHRAAFWAHNMHVVHTFSPLWIKQGYMSVGVAVKGRLGAAYRTVGFTYTRAGVVATSGDFTQLSERVGPSVDRILALDNSRPRSAGRALARLPGDAWWFDTTARRGTAPVRRWLAQPVWLGEVGWIVDPAKFQTGDVNEDSLPFGTGFDAMVWFRQMTPQHRWPGIAPVAPSLPKP